MREYGTYVVPIIMLVVGWICTRRPTSVVRFMTNWLDLPTPAGPLNKSQEMAKYVREHPDTWPKQYPTVYQQIQIIGFAAYLIFVVGFLLIFMSWLLPTTP